MFFMLWITEKNAHFVAEAKMRTTGVKSLLFPTMSINVTQN